MGRQVAAHQISIQLSCDLQADSSATAMLSLLTDSASGRLDTSDSRELEVYPVMNGRADTENRVKHLKYDFGSDSLRSRRLSG